MGIEGDISEIRKDLKHLKERSLLVGRPGLYIMTFLALANSCDTYQQITELRKEVKQLTRTECVCEPADYNQRDHYRK